MEELIHKIVRRLQHEGEGLSRNKNFHVFQDPQAWLAMKIYRHIRSLERDILDVGPEGGVRVERRGPHHYIKLDMRRKRGTRVSRLASWEYEALCENPHVRALLTRAERES